MQAMRWALVVGLALALAVHGVFDRVLKLNLPGGPLGLPIIRG